MRLHRIARASACVLTLMLISTLTSGMATAAPPPDFPTPTDFETEDSINYVKPKAAVALGDSFVSGESAGAYDDVRGEDFHDWYGRDTSAYFCHRSANSLIHAADLDGLKWRFNLACSGATPCNLVASSCGLATRRAEGGDLLSQADQLVEIAADYDIELVVVGIGSNVDQFNFGMLVMRCAARFVLDAGHLDHARKPSATSLIRSMFGDGTPDEVAAGWAFLWALGVTTEVRTDLPTDAEITAFAAAGTEDCANALPDGGDLDAIVAPTVDAITTVVERLSEAGQPPGTYRLVISDYANPLPEDFAHEFHKQNFKSEDADVFGGLLFERWDAGCPVHRSSLAAAHGFSEALGSRVMQIANGVAASDAALDVVYLNVQDAFDGYRLCENADPSDDAFAGMRLVKEPHHRYSESPVDFITSKDLKPGPPSLGGVLDISPPALTVTIGRCIAQQQFHWCQQSMHPNVIGHEILGACLTQAWRAGPGASIIVC